jgi:hypothetical protein
VYLNLNPSEGLTGVGVVIVIPVVASVTDAVDVPAEAASVGRAGLFEVQAAAAMTARAHARHTPALFGFIQRSFVVTD